MDRTIKQHPINEQIGEKDNTNGGKLRILLAYSPDPLLVKYKTDSEIATFVHELTKIDRFIHITTD